MWLPLVGLISWNASTGPSACKRAQSANFLAIGCHVEQDMLSVFTPNMHGRPEYADAGLDFCCGNHFVLKRCNL
jgi:hypothetical protein